MTNKKEPKTYIITEEVFSRIRETVGSQIPETGGILGSSDGKHVDHFYFDVTASVTGATYEPDCDKLNLIIQKWYEKGIEFVGFIHSHPRGAVKPSDPDNLYTTKIMKAFEMEWFVSLIVQVHRSLKGEKAKLFAYGYYLADPCCYFEFGRIDEKNPSFEFPAINLEEDQDRSYREMLAKKYPFSKEELNRRNKELFPEDVLARKTLFVGGTGGSIGLVLDMVRSGVIKIIICDGDTFETHNMSNQRITYDDIGKSKVEALKERILNINMDAEVKTFDEFIDDTVTDEDFERLIGDQLLTSPKDILICACTDSFEAQARLAALAMKYGTPFMAPQIYAGGVGAEIVFSYPDVTPSCPRCVLKSRYDAYKNGYKNTVTSECTPISAIAHANALEGQIALMLLLYHEGDNRYATMLDKVSNRNLALIKMSPDAENVLGINLFHDAVDDVYSFFGEVVWIPQVPVSEANGFDEDCPLCHGSGDLTTLIGKITDTRRCMEWKE